MQTHLKIAKYVENIRGTLTAHRRDPREFEGKYTDRGKRSALCDNLPREETWLVVEKYDHDYSDAVMRRWDEMEAATILDGIAARVSEGSACEPAE